MDLPRKKNDEIKCRFWQVTFHFTKNSDWFCSSRIFTTSSLLALTQRSSLQDNTKAGVCQYLQLSLPLSEQLWYVNFTMESKPDDPLTLAQETTNIIKDKAVFQRSLRPRVRRPQSWDAICWCLVWGRLKISNISQLTSENFFRICCKFFIFCFFMINWADWAEWRQFKTLP